MSPPFSQPGRPIMNRTICVFQPHTYTRTHELLLEFSTAFAGADEVIVTDIYAAREKDENLVHSKDLVAKIKQEANLKKNQTVLDYGCGCGITTFEIAKKVNKLVAADLSLKQLKRTLSAVKKNHLSNNIIMIKLSEMSPFKPGSFDRIISVLAINYFVNPEKELKALHRSLKRGGKIAMISILAPGITTHPFLKNDAEIRSVAVRAGFKKLKIIRKKKLANQWKLISPLTKRVFMHWPTKGKKRL